MSPSNRRFNIPTPQDDDVVPEELSELGQLIDTLSPTRPPELEVAFQRVLNTALRRNQTLERVQEALSQLRVDIKYLMFDLEITRRERDELRQRMEG
ncbi:MULTISPECIES: transcriptional regulator [unclassified Schlesneria]|uniref:transcriptional regulator n=1 Tax=Schlesneria TaxID=656899 RepID=UPI0035A03323